MDLRLNNTNPRIQVRADITVSVMTGTTSYVPTTVFNSYTGATNTTIQTLNADDISLSGFTKSQVSVQDILNSTQSAGRLTSGGDIVDNGDGTINVKSGTGLIKTQKPSIGDGFNNWGDVKFVSWDEIPSLAVTPNAYNFVYYDGSLGQITTTTNYYNISFYEDFSIGRVYNDNGNNIIRLCGQNLWNLNRRLHAFGEEYFGVVRASGLQLAETGTRNISVTAGILYAEMINRFETTAKDTSTGDVFNYYYRDGSGGFTKVTGQTQINNLNYDDGSGTLAVLTNNRYNVSWVYISHEGTIEVILGRENLVSINDAEVLQPYSDAPGLISAYCTLVGKIIIQKSAASFNEIQSAFVVAFHSTTTPDHNNLSNLQGGTANEYYHLTSSGYTNVNLIPTIQTSAKYEAITVACSDETTDLVSGTGIVEFIMPFAMTLDNVVASVTSPPSGSSIIVDINENGSSILSSELVIDAEEKTSVTSSSPVVISDNELAQYSTITIDLDQAGFTTKGTGLKVIFIGQRT